MVTQVVHEVDGRLHFFTDGEGEIADVLQLARTDSGIVVFQTYLFDFPHLREEKNAQAQKDSKHWKETDGGLVEGHLLELAIHEEEVHEFVLHLDRQVVLVVGLPVAAP